MLTYDILQPPPTRQELDAEKTHLSLLKKQLIKASVISDGCHGVCFVALYLFELISGYSLLLTILSATLVAVGLASSLKKQLRSTDLVVVAFSSLATAAAVSAVLIYLMGEMPLGGILAGLVSGSIVTAGAVIGRKFFHVFIGLENLLNVAEDEYSLQELQALCRKHPEVDEYRQQALDILRPNLNFGELQAMRAWSDEKSNT